MEDCLAIIVLNKFVSYVKHTLREYRFIYTQCVYYTHISYHRLHAMKFMVCLSLKTAQFTAIESICTDT